MSNDTMREARWIAVDEIGNDNFATSIYENDHKGLLVARCNQNGSYPWQGPAIIRGLEANKAPPPDTSALDRAYAALKPFAAAADNFVTLRDSHQIGHGLDVGDLRRAREVADELHKTSEQA